MEAAFVKWEEVFADGEKEGVRYYLKRKDGGSTLAVVGKEKSLRRMSYRYAIRDKDLVSVLDRSSMVKLSSRREVVDWLNSIITGSDLHPHQSPKSVCGSSEVKNDCDFNLENLKDVQLRKLGKHTTEFLWLGSALTYRKKKKHYPSFQRNGVKISVHNFVYVLAEEGKRLVAHLDDMYEDSKGKKMVVVRWFHKIDEVGIALPENYNDREIFFSLCLQDLSIECIDGLASVLSPQHYEKFMNEATNTRLEPFVCRRQFDNDDVKPFDITQVKGYADQEILKYIFSCTRSNNVIKVEENCTDPVGLRTKKRLRPSRDFDAYVPLADKPQASGACLEVPNSMDNSVDSCGEPQICLPKKGCSDDTLAKKEAVMYNHLQPLNMGDQVEVLSQDSGIRGCWFRALIIKKYKDKVKVRYQDVKDAADEVNNLEEWILASRIAIPDDWSLRFCGRTTIRPAPTLSKNSVSWVVKDGSVVDVWWHDSWWEGIVIRKESEDNILVYFPAEKQISNFALKDLRPSQEWVGAGWKQMKERPELVTSLLSYLESKPVTAKSHAERSPTQQAATCYDGKDPGETVNKEKLLIDNKVNDTLVVPDLAKDDSLAQLRWKSSRKRRHGRNSSQKQYDSDSKNKISVEVLGKRTWEKFFLSSSVKFDHDNCKYTRDSDFSSSVVPRLTSWVLSS